jgi:hypothetical protein
MVAPVRRFNLRWAGRASHLTLGSPTRHLPWHVAAAKARASQQEEKGTITSAEETTIDRKADRILGRWPPNRPKGSTRARDGGA